MRAPKSYTREDIVEINCHGGIVPLKKVLDLVLTLGARLAEPGEFTKRAFLNGRIDLAQAEAVLDVIRAKTDVSLRAALSQLSGRLSQQIKQIKDEILEILVRIEVIIDFPEEEVDEISYDELKKRTEGIHKDLTQLLATAKRGAILRKGVALVICGRPNVGKSTLLNVLLQQDRAIVSPIPGTTRDFIEEEVNIEGIPFKIVDTAGVFDTEDTIQTESVRRSRHYMERADLVLIVLDGSERLSEESKSLLRELREKTAVVVVNKIDFPQQIDLDEVYSILNGKRVVQISATEKKGISLLERTIVDMVWQGEVSVADEVIITNVRHRDALRKAALALEQALGAMAEGRSIEIIAVDFQQAINGLGEIAGETVTEDILDKIFSEFCIGK
jgi:tRNA modification GTPase